MKFWLVVGGGDTIMTDRGWSRRNYAWSLVVVSGSGKIMAGCGWSHDLVMPCFFFLKHAISIINK